MVDSVVQLLDDSKYSFRLGDLGESADENIWTSDALGAAGGRDDGCITLRGFGPGFLLATNKKIKKIRDGHIREINNLYPIDKLVLRHLKLQKRRCFFKFVGIIN